MRTEKSIKNVIVAFISNFLSIFISFVAQIFFVKYLGKEILGLNGLFTNVVSMLGIVELGLGTALIYHLYEPVANNDKESIKSLMKFYKKSYHLISLIIFLLGILLIPFLQLFVKTTLNINISLIFFLFIIESSSTYLLSYKRSILYAYQENYITNIIKIVYILGLNIFQIIILIILKNYFLFLLLKIGFRFLENLLITIYANKHYEFIKDKNVKPLNKKTKSDIFKKIKGLLFHKIGTYIVMGTDNIIISRFLGLVSVGIFSNYSLIINGIKNLFSQVFYSITSSVGNLLVEKNETKSFNVYNKMIFGNFWLATFCSISFFIISKPFVILWLGKEFILSKRIVFLLMIQLFLDIYGYTIGAFKNAAGIYHEDRFIPVIQSIINLIVSIILVIKMGLFGVVIGTIASYSILYFFSYPKYVYCRLFKKTLYNYYLDFSKKIAVFVFIFLITMIISEFSLTNNTIIDLIYSVVCCLVIPNALIYLFYHNTSEFNYYKYLLIKKLIKKNR